jgi:hypothetical protein
MLHNLEAGINESQQEFGMPLLETKIQGEEARLQHNV